ncbi:MAG: hypothetical protein ACKVY0_01170 [Prosthecobacter sp.]|uniref:hypothetical protein n=1 Tax=Prosthecobacter sp. TaxID=1965333 RepID=UPI00390318AC
MSLPQIVLDAPTLKLILCIVGGLLLIAMVRITFLLRTNNRLRDSTAKMEKQVLTQHQEILAVRQDSNAWRGELQRMFDAFRAEFSKRLTESEQRYHDIQQRQAAVTPPPPPSSESEAVLESPVEPVVSPVPALAIS